MTKTCSHCRRDLPLAAFGSDVSRIDGLTYWCGECRNAQARSKYVPADRPFVVACCSLCGKVKTPQNTARMASAGDGYQTHCKVCKRGLGRAWRAANARLHGARTRQWECDHPEWKREYDRAWGKRNPEVSRAKTTRRRARQAGAFVEEVVRLVLLERDDGTCGICGGDVDPLDFHLDHIIPLAAGGEHSYANTQVAHPSCNVRKGASLAFMSTAPISSGSPSATTCSTESGAET